MNKQMFQPGETVTSTEVGTVTCDQSFGEVTIGWTTQTEAGSTSIA